MAKIRSKQQGWKGGEEGSKNIGRGLDRTSYSLGRESKKGWRLHMDLVTGGKVRGGLNQAKMILGP